MGVYLAFNPDLLGVKQGAWYAEVRNNKIFEEQSASIEEVAKTAQELKDMALKLKNMVSNFKL